MALRFDIGPDGRASAFEVVEDTLDDPCVARCVIEVGKRLWSWPRVGSGTITITYPFLFDAP